MPDNTAGPRQVSILVLDDDVRGHGILRQILDSEGWGVHILPDPRVMLGELATGKWSLVIANIALTGFDTPVFQTLRELALVPVEEGARVRVLFLIPEMGSAGLAPALERDHLPYVVRPFHLHDFLEKVSDLLLEIKAIENPIRQVRYELAGLRRQKQKSGRQTSMFATRESYSYSEEELAEYERTEEETKKKKPPRPLTDLGNPRS